MTKNTLQYFYLQPPQTHSVHVCKNTWQPFRLHHQPTTVVLKTPSDTHQLGLHKHVEVLKHALVIVYKIKILGTKYVHLYTFAYPTQEHILHMHIALPQFKSLFSYSRMKEPLHSHATFSLFHHKSRSVQFCSCASDMISTQCYNFWS